MAEKVKLSKDGNSIDFVQSESIPTSVKKFRQSPEIEGFYRFIFENDLQKETYEILERIIQGRKAKRKAEKAEASPKKVVAEPAPKIELPKKAVAAKKVEAPIAVKPAKAAKTTTPAPKVATKPAPAKKAAPAKAAKPAAKATKAVKVTAPAKKKSVKKK